MEDYKEIARQARIKVLEMIFKAQTSHIGSNFSVIDILAVLFAKADFTKDKIILSAGWKAAAFYYFLAQKGIIPKEALDTYCQEGSPYIGLTEPMLGVHFAGGSMGLGFPAAVGFALAKKLKGEEGKVYCLMSDGEMQVGTTWESALLAAHHKLDNLVIIVDWNKLQAMGRTRYILALRKLSLKWQAFEWGIGEIDGHNFEHLQDALSKEVNLPFSILAHTIKGKGVSFMENNNLYHYKAPNEEEYNLALKELNG